MRLLIRILLISSLISHQSLYAASRPILIQGAMDFETDVLIQSLNHTKIKTLGSWTFWSGELKNVPTVISRTNIGIANAAAATALAIAQFHPRLIINQGTSGGHDPKLHQGDLVIGEKTLNIGSYQSPLTAKGAGVHPENWQLFTDTMKIRKNGKPAEYHEFKSDKYLLDKALAIAGSYTHGKVIKGVIGTADQWNRELDRINWYHKKYATSVEEMETSAAALVAESFHIPFIAIRVVSNTDVHKQKFEPKTAKFCQLFVIKFIKALSAYENQISRFTGFNAFITETRHVRNATAPISVKSNRQDIKVNTGANVNWQACHEAGKKHLSMH